MKKQFTLLLITAIILSCSSSSDDSTSNSKSTYNPPTWIIGTWGIKSNVTSSNNALYKFTSDNVCQLTSVSSTCWKEAIQQTPTGLSGNDKSTSTTYIANFISGNGATTVTLNFEKVSSTQIKWKNTSLGDTVLEKLD